MALLARRNITLRVDNREITGILAGKMPIQRVESDVGKETNSSISRMIFTIAALDTRNERKKEAE